MRINNFANFLSKLRKYKSVKIEENEDHPGTVKSLRKQNENNSSKSDTDYMAIPLISNIKVLNKN